MRKIFVLNRYFVKMIFSNSLSVFLFTPFLLGMIRHIGLIQPQSSSVPSNKSVKERFAERKQNMESYCENSGDMKGLTYLDEYHFIESLPSPLVFCIPKKVGSLSLDSYFLNNLDSTDQLSWMQGPMLDSKENILKDKRSVKVMVTRHPLERLASAYNHLFITGLQDYDLFLCADTGTQWCQYTRPGYLAHRIVSRIRDDQHLNDSLLTFPEFISYVVDQGQQFQDIRSEMKENYPGVAFHWEPYSR